MLNFKHIKQVLTDMPIESQEDFNESEYAGVDTLLNAKDYNDLLFVFTDDDDPGEIEEAYFFLDANAKHIRRNGNMLLVEMDKTMYVLLDFHNEYAIAIHKNDQNDAQLLTY